MSNPDGQTALDQRWMGHALSLARGALGNVWPNPAVGCVLVRGDRIVGAGRTQPGGRPHAETIALEQAGEAARGATAYVTLEPCSHHGKTPPCADALIAAGIDRAVVAIRDPDPRVSGRGIAALEAAGISVETGCHALAAEAMNAGFLTRLEHGRPIVALKLATSLDGRIALASGESRWITGPQARLYVHGLRARHDAVLVGAGTARGDDPMLDVRDVATPQQPVRIVTDPNLSLPMTSRLLQTASTQPVWLLHGPGVDRSRARTMSELGATLIETRTDETGALDLADALQALGKAGLTRVLCEGGGRLAAGLIRADLVDQMIRILSGKVIGGDGTASVGALGAESLDTVPRFNLVEARPLGPDLMTRWVRNAIVAPEA